MVAAIHSSFAQSESSSSRASKDGLTNYSKNLARLHLGATLLSFDEKSRTYNPTEATPTWLDDDEATGWTPPTGKRYYLLALAEPTIINHIALSATDAEGTITLYSGDERATPDSSTWRSIASGLSVEALNEKINSGAYSRYGRFLLIETDLKKSGPWWSLYVYGTEKAVDYRIEPRVQKVDTASLLGPNINHSTVFDLTNLYSGARVTQVANGGNFASWQSMIDESPESFWLVPGSKGDAPSFVIDMGSDRTLRRVSAMIAPQPGVLEFFLLKGGEEPAIQTADASSSEYIKVSSTSGTAGETFNLKGRVPLCTLGFDGLSDREAIDFAPAEGRYLVVRWKGSSENENLQVHQIDGFGTYKFDEYAVVSDLPAIAERQYSEGDGKSVSSGKDFKMLLDPIAEGPVDPPAIAQGPAPLLGSNIPFLPAPLLVPPPLVPPPNPPIGTSNRSPE